MTPRYRYKWTPAGEPPDTNRDVLIWADDGLMYIGAYIRRRDGARWEFFGVMRNPQITHWRDVEPPNGEKK